METTLGKRIVQNRKRIGLTQDQLAEQLGVTAQAVSKWENDQSCPDINMLPRLSDIFGISTDELLGREAPAPVYVGTVDSGEGEGEGEGEETQKWEFRFDSGRKSSLCFGLTVLTVGVLYLLSKILHWDADFWDILWPTIPLIYGLFGIYPFSTMRMACAIVGGYFLVNNLGLLSFSVPGELVWPAIIILFGVWLVAKAVKKPRRAKIKIKDKSPKQKENMVVGSRSFEYSASFGESTQYVEIDCLKEGSVSTGFGEYTVDLSGVEAVEDDCTIELSSAFGELTLLVPRRFSVRPNSSTFLAQFEIVGNHDEDPTGAIRVNGNAALGEILIKYI